MRTIPTSKVPARDVSVLEGLANEVGPELRTVIVSLSNCIREGADLAIVDDAATFTPSEASSRLGISRTYLYKLLDRDEIASHRVGRDRRIRLSDLLEFEARRSRDRGELAERFAAQSATREGAIDELVDLL